MQFHGSTYNAAHDEKRLTFLSDRVFDLMSDGEWRTLREIAGTCNGSEASVSARLRDFRKEQWGSHTVNRRRRGRPEDGIFEYQLLTQEKPVTVKYDDQGQGMFI